MAAASVLALALALLSPRACWAARERTNLDVEKTNEECDGSIVLEPSQSDPGRKALQAQFDAKRRDKGLLHEGFVKKDTEPKKYVLEEGSEKWDNMVAKCSKYDVCLLMKQLDMEFYQRARIGNLVDEDFKTPPTLMPIMRGNCHWESRMVNKIIADDISKLEVATSTHPLGRRIDKGFRMTELRTKEECSRRLGNIPVDEVAKEDRPRGCYYSRAPGKDTPPAKAYFNTLPTEVMAGIIEIKDPKKSAYAQANRIEYVQVCEMDRSLSPAAASYYSPYKLKERMWQPEDNQRAKMSTSCSFGMMSFLAKQKRTQSACAKILATTEWEDSELKRKLMSVIANEWCPHVWEESTKGDRTCKATRSPHWARTGGSEEDIRAESLRDFEEAMDKERLPKQALTMETCDWYLENGADQTLEDLM